MVDIKRRGQTLVGSYRATCWVNWYRGNVPPGVKIGADVIAYGKIMTFGNARTFQVVDAVLITGKTRKEIASALSAMLAGSIVEPRIPNEAKTNGHGQP